MATQTQWIGPHVLREVAPVSALVETEAHPCDLLTGAEWTPAALRELYHLAADVKAHPERYRAGLAGRSVALVEQMHVGGECPFVACIPSKAMLRSSHVRAQARRLVRLGAVSAPLPMDADRDAFRAAVRRRDELSAQRDDSAKASSIRDRGVTLLRGHARITGPDRVDVDGR